MSCITRLTVGLSGQKSYDVRTAGMCETFTLLIGGKYRSKLKLYASLHATLQNQRNVLDKREEMLKHAREGLVRDGANVVAGKSGAIAPGKGKENAED